MEGNLANLRLNTEQLDKDLPDGEYVAKITADVIKDDSLTLTFTVFDGPFYGRTIRSTYKLWNDVEKTREGAKTAFLFLCKSLGVNEPRDTTDLRGIPFVMVVGHREWQGKQYANVIATKQYSQKQDVPF